MNSSICLNDRLILNSQDWKVTHTSRTFITDTVDVATWDNPYVVQKIASGHRAEIDVELQATNSSVKLPDLCDAMFMLDGILYIVSTYSFQYGVDELIKVSIHAKSIWIDDTKGLPFSVMEQNQLQDPQQFLPAAI